MKLTFSLTEPGALALIEQFYKDSPSCKRMRNRTRWVLPILLLPIAFLFILKFGFSLPTVAVFVVATVGWFIFAPSRFDASVRRNAKKMMKESAYAKCFGLYTIQINQDSLVSDSVTGHSEFKWSAVDQAILTENYLFIFLLGGAGWPIRISDIGNEDATIAHSRIQQLIERVK